MSVAVILSLWLPELISKLAKSSCNGRVPTEQLFTTQMKFALTRGHTINNYCDDI